MLSDVSTAIIFMELHRRLADYSVGQSQDQFFLDVETSNAESFSKLDIAMHSAFIAHAEVVLKRVHKEVDDE